MPVFTGLATIFTRVGSLHFNTRILRDNPLILTQFERVRHIKRALGSGSEPACLSLLGGCSGKDLQFCREIRFRLNYCAISTSA
jgi:hypothetical protein